MMEKNIHQKLYNFHPKGFVEKKFLLFLKLLISKSIKDAGRRPTNEKIENLPPIFFFVSQNLKPSVS